MEAAGELARTEAESAAEELIGAVRELSAVRQLGDVQRVVRGAARRLTGADGATFVLRDGDLCHYADEDAIAPLWKGRRFPVETCISGWAMLNRTPAAIEDIYADPRIPHDAYRPTFVSSLVMVPIRTADPLGAIGNYWAERHAPSERELGLLESLADATALAIENVRVRELAQLDELTGINNRRGFFELGIEAFEATAAVDGECAAAFVDLDGLKLVNDTFGHEAGSELIRAAARALAEVARPGDIVGRLGGDELALLRPSGAASPQSLHAEIAAAIGRASHDGLPCRLAVSIGVALARPAVMPSFDRLLARADEAMYRNKPRALGPPVPHVRASSRD